MMNCKDVEHILPLYEDDLLSGMEKQALEKHLQSCSKCTKAFAQLQKTGRIGRIEVDIKTKVGKSAGTVVVPSSLDMVETSIIAAAVETVDRVGPCNASIQVKDIEDARSSKRKQIIDRAKELLKKLVDEEIPESDQLTEEVKKSVQLSEITSYQGLPSGPGIESAESIILVEGRADVLTLLKCGIKNVVAVGGTNVPKQVIDLSKEKTTIAFLDGDRGGEIILKELTQVSDVDFVARAPKGKEVEELGRKEIIMALRRKVPLSQVRGYEDRKDGDRGGDRGGEPRTEEFRERPVEHVPHQPPVQQPQQAEERVEDAQKLLELLRDVKGKLTARLFDRNLELITEIEIKDLVDSLRDVQPHCIVFDGVVTQRLVDAAAESRVNCIVGVNKSAITNTKRVNILTEKE